MRFKIYQIKRKSDGKRLSYHFSKTAVGWNYSGLSWKRVDSVKEHLKWLTHKHRTESIKDSRGNYYLRRILLEEIPHEIAKYEVEIYDVVSSSPKSIDAADLLKNSN